MLLCVKTVSYNFCVNGAKVGPVSPYLFLICMEGLSNALDKAFDQGRLHGCQISLSVPIISHLLFVDDNFLFFRGTNIEAQAVKSILMAYERSSGQSINYQKSGIYFSANIRRDKQMEITNILGVHNDISNTHNLGLPYLVGRSKKLVFGYLKERASQRTQGWSKKPMSRARKTVLIKNVAQAIPAYIMQCFLLPKKGD